MFSLDWPYAYGAPPAKALFKSSPEDFKVNELFEGSFSGEGEHILLKIEKKGLNTEDVVKSLARLLNRPIKSISYAGLKDRQAITTQWLSIHAPGEEIEGIDLISETGWRVLEYTRHSKKLKPGFLSGNQFILRLKEVSDIDVLVQRIELIKTRGVPNYFGEQRFGRNAGNLYKAEQILVEGRKIKDRFLKGMYFSAARSWIFNSVLAKRVEENTWNIPINGDLMQLGGTHSVFSCSEVTDELNRRVIEKDISPTSPLPGKTKSLVSGDALELIQKVYEQWNPWILGLEKQGLEESWRANIIHPEQLEYSIEDRTVELTFNLPAGSYATTVLRELVSYE